MYFGGLTFWDNRIVFGGEFVFNKSDSLETAVDTLFNIGCEIGGLAQQCSDNHIRVTGDMDGYFEFYWDDPSKGVSFARYYPKRDNQELFNTLVFDSNKPSGA